MAAFAHDGMHWNDSNTALVSDDPLELEHEVWIKVLGKFVLLCNDLIKDRLVLGNECILDGGLLFDLLSLLSHDLLLDGELHVELVIELLLGNEALSERLLGVLGILYLFLKGLELSGLGDGLHHLLAGLPLYTGLIEPDAKVLELFLHFLALVMKFKHT